MNSSLETNTEVNLNIFAVTETVTKTVTSTVTKTVTEKLKKTSRETLLGNVENVLQNITNLTEESQYNETFVDSDSEYFSISMGQTESSQNTVIKY